MELLIVSGMSGAGKTQALRTLEDIGYYCVDNMPPQLFVYLLDQDYAGGMVREKMAVTVDIRSELLLSSLEITIQYETILSAETIVTLIHGIQ